MKSVTPNHPPPTCVTALVRNASDARRGISAGRLTLKGRASASVVVLLGLAVWTLTFEAAAQVVPITWDSARKFERTLTVAPGKVEEVCGTLQRAQRVAWKFEASEAVDFNIHYHEGNQVRYPARADASRSAVNTLIVDQPQDYCWMWSNKQNTPATVRLQLSSE